MTYVNGKYVPVIWNGKQLNISLIIGQLLTSDGTVFVTADGKRLFITEV